MLFQVIKNGKVMFQTEHEQCAPDEQQIKEMQKAGYHIRRKKGKDEKTGGRSSKRNNI